jgi:hypothetical protein
MSQTYRAVLPSRQLWKKRVNLIKEAIEFHIETMRNHGDAVPKPTRHIEQIEVSV